MKAVISRNKKGLLSKILLGFFFAFCCFGLSSCASAKNDGTYQQNYSYSYNAETDITKFEFATYVENNSIKDIKSVSYSYKLYKDDAYIREVKDVEFSISLKHGESKTFYETVLFYGNVDKVTISDVSSTWSNVWETYKGWFIGTIVVASVVAVALVVLYFVTDGDVLDVIEDFGGPVAIGLISVVSTGSIIIGTTINWVPLCIILGGLVAVAILIGLAALIAYLIEEFDLDLYIEGKYVALIIFSLILIGGFVCGCIFWVWWICLLILVGLVGLGIGTFFLARFLTKLSDKRDSKILKEYKANTEETQMEQTSKTPKTYKSKISFDDIAGLDEAKEAFKEKVILPFEHPELFEKFGKKAGGGILLYGLPGTGKTMFAEATSKELNATFIPVKCSDIKSKWYGESEQNVKAIFAKAKRSKKAIIFFDEFEAIGAKRTDDGNNGNNDLVPEILAEMQGIGASECKSTIMVIAATNKPWAIDSAFLRPGRFDEKIYIPLPDFVARKKLFEIQLAKLPVADDLDYDYLANITDGFNGADIKEVCEKLKMSAIKDSIEKGKEQTIGMDDVARIEKTIKSSVSKEDIERLKEFEENK